jgi:hypothetical protein
MLEVNDWLLMIPVAKGGNARSEWLQAVIGARREDSADTHIHSIYLEF